MTSEAACQLQTAKKTSTPYLRNRAGRSSAAGTCGSLPLKIVRPSLPANS